MNLREYQIKAQDDLTQVAADGKRRLLLQAACGAGKTVIAAQIVRHATSNGRRVLFLAHRRELVNQAVEKLRAFGVDAATIMAGDCWEKGKLVDVASIQTLHSWCVRRKHESLPQADLVVIDECHHFSSAKTWQEVLDGYPDALLLGMTATPINRRGKGLGHFFDAMIKCPSIQSLTDSGHLVPARYYAPSIPDLKGLKIQAGDYSEKELAERVDKPQLVGDVPENWARVCPDRKTMVFATGIKHSIHIVEAFKAIGVKAAHVDGATPQDERDSIVKDFSDGDLQVLSNCAVFTEGTDIPAASCLIFARPTKSLLLYLQVAGRVLRPFPGKQNAIILDHAGAVFEHGQVAQEWDWQLDYGNGDAKSATQRRAKLKKEILCQNCKMVYWGQLECPSCQWKPTIKGKAINTYPGYLQALDEIEQEKNGVDEKSWFRQLKHYAAEKGYKPGYAAVKFKDKFFRWPPRQWNNLEPLEPGMVVKSWITSQNIRWAKSRRNPMNQPEPTAPLFTPPAAGPEFITEEFA